MDGFSKKLERFVMQNIMEELLGKASVTVEVTVKCAKNIWMIVFSQAPDVEKWRIKGMLFSVVQTVSRTIQCPVNAYFAYGSSFDDIRERYMSLESLCRHCMSDESAVFDLDDYPEQEMNQKILENTEETEDVVEKVQKYIDEHFCEEIEAGVLEEITFYSSGYVAKLFKRRTGISLGAYVIEKRMELARKLLQENQMPVSEIAQEVGYDNFTYFSRLFRKKTGMAPKEYRKSKTR